MFYNIRFPEYISCKFKVEINFDTSLVINKNGKEQRLLNRYNSINTYTLDIGNNILSISDIDEITKIFRIANGRFGSFRFKDWLDYKATNQQIAIADGKTNKFQLIKTYSISKEDNGTTTKYIRIISKPVADTIALKIGNHLIDDNNYTIDYNNGIITLATVPEEGKIISCDFEFDVPVRFDSDTLEIKQTNSNNGELKEIRLVEVG